jgi:general secretion pathway protein K
MKKLSLSPAAAGQAPAAEPPRYARATREQGAALLAAMLTVTLVATFAAAALWQQWRSIEVEAAERSRVQSAWVLTGAVDWARLLLREDAKAGGPDHLGEPWAVPLQEARLSSFLAADRSNTSTGETGPEVFDAFLSGEIVDLQSRLNVTNLVKNGTRSEADYTSFARLFEQLGLPPAQLDMLAENLRFALDASPANRSSPMAALLPQRVEQLVWLGLGADTVAALQPFITILPSRANVNLNTASAEVIYAAVSDLSMSDAQRLVAARQSAPFRSVDQAWRLLGKPPATSAEALANVAVNTLYFEVHSRLRLDQMVVQERAVLLRDGSNNVKIVQRQHGAADPTTATTEAGKR